MQKISGHEYPIKRIFSNQFQFEIPSYQRPYAWTTEQAGEMMDDFLGFMSQSGTRANDDPYFLGSVVLIKQENEPKAEVIDGQQRLTTLTILLAAIADKVSGHMREALMPYINEPGNLAEDLEPQPRLALRERDREFFRHYIQTGGNLRSLLDSEPNNDPRINIRDNAALFIKRLADLDEDRAFELGKFIVNRCYLIAVSTPSLQSAYRIFSVMNNRGLDLLPSDILKADIIGAMPERQRDPYSDRWEEVEEILGREGLSELLAHIRMIYRRAKQQRTLLEEVREYVLSAQTSQQSFIDDVLCPFADAFEVIRKAAYESTGNPEQVNRTLEWLLRIDNFDWMPPSIVFMHRHGRRTDLLAQFFKALERLAASMFIRRCSINERIDRYVRLLDHIDTGEDLWKEESPLMLTPEERARTLKALDGDVYLVSRTRIYILLRLDGWLAEASAAYDHSVITVEHVLPQTVEVGSEWDTWWPDEEKRAIWVHRLGNLVLLSRRKNSSAQNHPFAVKKKKYFQSSTGVSPFALTTGVLEQETWTPDIVAKRQAELLEVLRRGWDL